MPIGQGLLVAALGFGVVFLMLSILWASIAIVARVVAAMEKKKAPAEVPGAIKRDTASEPETVQLSLTGAFGGEVKLYDVDDKTAACIMAIVSDETKIPLNELVFKSIRAIA